MTLSKAQKDSRRVRKFKDDPVKQVTGVPNKKPIRSPSERFSNASTYRKPEFNAGVTYHEQEQEEDYDVDNWAATPVYDRPSE